MSQSFSLYARADGAAEPRRCTRGCSRCPAPRSPRASREMLDRFDLAARRRQLPDALPLGMRQRLQLAVAVIHRPEMLILDEPTSGVDPIARDGFWRLLIELSRKDGVTIFISTHFMNEAARCDRISLMHAGTMLAVGTPQELMRDARRGHARGGLHRLSGGGRPRRRRGGAGGARQRPPMRRRRRGAGDALEPGSHAGPSPGARRSSSCATRSASPSRCIGPLILMLTFGFGISFDRRERCRYAALDQRPVAGKPAAARELLRLALFQRSSRRSIAGRDRPPPARAATSSSRSRSRRISAATCCAGDQPEIGVWLDGAMPFRAETTRGYVQGVIASYLADQSRRETGRATSPYPADDRAALPLQPGVPERLRHRRPACHA